MMKRKYSGKNETQIIATNIDVAFVIESVDKDYSLNRFERYFAIANDGGIKSAIILNKIDLISKEELDSKLNQIKNRFSDIDVFPTSTITDEGLDKNVYGERKDVLFSWFVWGWKILSGKQIDWGEYHKNREHKSSHW